MRLILSALILLNFMACSSYVNRIHNQISRESGAKRGPQRRYDPYAKYRPNTRYIRSNDRRPIQNPKTLGGYANTASTRNMAPSTRREYQRRGGRVKAADLKDNSGDGSLWSSKNSESFLFVTNNIKKKGDIVIIEVMSKLKDTIQDELKRTFPERKKKKKKGEEDKDKKEGEETTVAATEANNPNEVYDKISTQVVEQINKDYLLVRGRKEVLFKEFKRYIEVQGLVPKKYINDNDSIDSDSILEPKITVLRY